MIAKSSSEICSKINYLLGEEKELGRLDNYLFFLFPNKLLLTLSKMYEQDC